MTWWILRGPWGQPESAPLLLLCRRNRWGTDGAGQGQGRQEADRRGRRGDSKGRSQSEVRRCAGAGSGSSYTGLPRPSQCSSSFWPSRGCGGSGLIFAVGVSVEKERASAHNGHTVRHPGGPPSRHHPVAHYGFHPEKSQALAGPGTEASTPRLPRAQSTVATERAWDSHCNPVEVGFLKICRGGDRKDVLTES